MRRDPIAFGTAQAHQTQGDSPTGPAGSKCGANVVAVPDNNTAGAVYIDNRYVTTGGAFSVWIYLESNNHQGLQTKAGTVSSVDETDLENCTTAQHNGMAVDTLIP